VVSSDLNPRYVDCWPLARRAWREVTGLEPILVLVAQPDAVPIDLRRDENVHVFEPVDGLHTALQAQCIRLLYPALLGDAGGVLTSDVDMVPLNPWYFHRPAELVDERHFVSYRSALLAGKEIPICYNAARPRTWSDVFAVRSMGDARARLAEWGAGLRYDGVRGGHGWDTDQVVLYATVVERGARMRDVWILDDRFTGHRRLVLAAGARVPGDVGRDVARGAYSDFHLLHPHSEHVDVNESVVDLAVSGPGRGASTARLRPRDG
jgi:hypothetical protein